MSKRNTTNFFRRFITVMKHGWKIIIRGETIVRTMNRSRKCSKENKNSSINRKGDDCFLGFSYCVHRLFGKRKNYQENIMQHYWINWMILLRSNVLIQQRKKCFFIMTMHLFTSFHFFTVAKLNNNINYA